MDESIELKFVKQLFSDENLQAKLSECKKPEDAYNVVKLEGYDVEFSDFKVGMDRLNEIIEQAKQIYNHDGELSENDLEMVAGGRSSRSKTFWKGFGELAAETAITAAAELAVSAAA